MVYKISPVQIEGITGGRKGPSSKSRRAQVQIGIESFWAKLLLFIIKCTLSIFDLLTLPIYYILQRPDKRAKDALRQRSEQVDANTWIKKMDEETSQYSHLKKSYHGDTGVSKYMGCTVSEIFANAVKEYGSRRCLGYRAVVTCPMISINDEGQKTMQEKSFRSAYTWYTYDQIGRRVQDMASGLYFHAIYPTAKALFIAQTGLEWFCVSQACFQLSVQLVVAPDLSDITSLRFILKQTQVEVIFISCDRISLLSQLLESTKSQAHELQVKRIVVIDWLFAIDFNEPVFAQLRESTAHLVEEILSIGQVEEAGVENPIELSCTGPLLQSDNDCAETLATSKNLSRASSALDMNTVLNTGSSTLRRRTRLSAASILDGWSKSKSVQSSRNNSNEDLVRSSSKLSRCSFKASSPRFSKIHQENILVTAYSSPKPNDLAMIVYTHGPLGQIKALMLTHSYLARCNHYLFLDGLIDGTDIHCTTLPLDNVIEFMTEMCVFSHGGSIGYSCSPRTLFYDGKDLFTRDLSDLEALEPTFLMVKPFNLENLRTSVQNYLSSRMNPIISFLMTNVLYEYKKYWTRRHFKTPLVDRLFCSKLKRLFGKNLSYILCTSATDCSETKDFFDLMIDIPVIELYGPDEAVVCSISVNDVWFGEQMPKKVAAGKGWRCMPFGTEYEDDEQLEDYEDMQLMFAKVNRNTFREDSSRNLLFTSSILCPTLGTRTRLEDWEDFRTTDRPCPRGRLVIGGDIVCKGYYRGQGLTEGCFYKDSNEINWFRTNDIARVFPNGSFEIISGMSDMIKMVDGQFISLSQIEHILRNSQFVDNVCAICGDDKRSIIALVVPNLRCLAHKSPGEANLKMAIGMEPEPDELIDIEFRREVCNDRLLCEFVNKHLNELIAKAGFQIIPSRFHLVPEIWTPETELVTPSFEPKRSAIRKYYAADIQSVFGMDFNSSGTRLSSKLSRSRKFSNPTRFQQQSNLGGSRLSC